MSLYQTFASLLSDAQRDQVKYWELAADGYRHPTWFPTFAKNQEKRIIDYQFELILPLISSSSEGSNWLAGLVPRLMDFDNIEDAFAAQAEIRAYGLMLHAGFAVTPIPTTSKPTPDFQITIDGEQTFVEVFSRQLAGDQKERINRVNRGETPEGVERGQMLGKGYKADFSIMEVHPAGAPVEGKAGDSTTANLISKICSAKGTEHQAQGENPTILWLDFSGFGRWSDIIKTEQAAPILSGRAGTYTSGGVWYGLYGWKGAPILEEDYPGRQSQVLMGHEGRFRMIGSRKSRLAGVIAATASNIAFLENPCCEKPIGETTRWLLPNLERFDASRSIANWTPDLAEKTVTLHREYIEAVGKRLAP